MNGIIRLAHRLTSCDLISPLLIPSTRNITFLWRQPSCNLSSHRNSPTRRRFTSSTFQYIATGGRWLNSAKPHTRDRGPRSSEDTQTDFGNLDVYRNAPPPSTSIDACVWDGFHLNNGVRIIGGMGALLVAGEAFSWQPWKARTDGAMKLLNVHGQWEVDDEAWGVFELVWPRPDLLVLGLGREMQLVSPKTRHRLNYLGIRLEVQDTRNAAAQFNLLATERGLSSVAAALIPIGWQEGVGISSEQTWQASRDESLRPR